MATYLNRLALWWLSRQMNKDFEYAWSWHCAIAMAAYDTAHEAGIGSNRLHHFANSRAADLMWMAFKVDIRKHPRYWETIGEEKP